MFDLKLDEICACLILFGQFKPLQTCSVWMDFAIQNSMILSCLSSNFASQNFRAPPLSKAKDAFAASSGTLQQPAQPRSPGHPFSLMIYPLEMVMFHCKLLDYQNVFEMLNGIYLIKHRSFFHVCRKVSILCIPSDCSFDAALCHISHPLLTPETADLSTE